MTIDNKIYIPIKKNGFFIFCLVFFTEIIFFMINLKKELKKIKFTIYSTYKNSEDIQEWIEDLSVYIDLSKIKNKKNKIGYIKEINYKNKDIYKIYSKKGKLLVEIQDVFKRNKRIIKIKKYFK